MKAATTIVDLQHGVRRLEEAKGFEITPERRLAYPTPEVGEVAAEVLGVEIYDAICNPLDLADMAGADLERAFAREARLNEDREW